MGETFGLSEPELAVLFTLLPMKGAPGSVLLNRTQLFSQILDNLYMLQSQGAAKNNIDQKEARREWKLYFPVKRVQKLECSLN